MQNHWGIHSNHSKTIADSPINVVTHHTLCCQSVTEIEKRKTWLKSQEKVSFCRVTEDVRLLYGCDWDKSACFCQSQFLLLKWSLDRQDQDKSMPYQAQQCTRKKSVVECARGEQIIRSYFFNMYFIGRNSCFFSPLPPTLGVILQDICVFE